MEGEKTTSKSTSENGHKETLKEKMERRKQDSEFE